MNEAWVREQEAVAFLSDLVQINTVNPPGNEKEAARYVADRMGKEGMDVEVMEVSPGRANVVAWLGGRSQTPALMLNGHLDTVPVGEAFSWNIDPFKGEVKDGRIYGRGVADNKGGVAAIFLAALGLHRMKVKLSAPVIVTGVMAEETGGAGTIAIIDQGIRPRLAIVAEWTSARKIALGYRGRIELMIETRGRTAHGSRPHQGINAVEHMMDLVLPAIRKYIRELPFTPRPEFMIHGPSVAVTMIQGGVKVNVIPDLCQAQLDIRLAPGQAPAEVEAGLETLMARLRQEISDLQVSLNTGVKKFPFVTSPETFLVRELSSCIRDVLGREVTLVGKTGCSDGNIIAERLRIPVIAYGPGNDTGHAPNEFIETPDFLDSIKVLTEAIPRLTARAH